MRVLTVFSDGSPTLDKRVNPQIETIERDSGESEENIIKIYAFLDKERKYV